MGIQFFYQNGIFPSWKQIEREQTGKFACFITPVISWFNSFRYINVLHKFHTNRQRPQTYDSLILTIFLLHSDVFMRENIPDFIGKSVRWPLYCSKHMLVKPITYAYVHYAKLILALYVIDFPRKWSDKEHAHIARFMWPMNLESPCSRGGYS